MALYEISDEKADLLAKVLNSWDFYFTTEGRTATDEEVSTVMQMARKLAMKGK